MISKEKIFKINILVAVDESENARRAVSYMSQLMAGVKGFKVIILHVVRQPEEDYFPTSAEKDQWLGQYKLKVDAMLKDYRQILIREGFAPEDVSIRSTIRYCPSLAECVLAERDKMKCSTIVLGRQGLSRSEEFLLAVSPKRLSTMRAIARSGWWNSCVEKETASRTLSS